MEINGLKYKLKFTKKKIIIIVGMHIGNGIAKIDGLQMEVLFKVMIQNTMLEKEYIKFYSE
jgi:hypothetical protein